MDTALTYISFVLSIIALTLFVISGFQVNQESTRDQKAVSTSYVWMYNETSGVARVRDGVSSVCVGFTDDECAAASISGSENTGGLADVRFKHAVELGGRVFRVLDGGHTMVVEANNRQVLRVDLQTGSVVVGQGGAEEMPPDGGMKIVGLPSTDAEDSEMWNALSHIDLHASGSPMAFATLTQVAHKQDDLVRGVRVQAAQPLQHGSARGFVATPRGLIVGEAPASFIDANIKGADVLVFGSSYCGDTRTVDEPPTCTGMPLGELDLNNATFHQLLKVHVDSCSSPDYIEGAEVVDYGTKGFAGCLSGWAFFNDERAQIELGRCYESSQGKHIHYCRLSSALA